MKKVLLCLPMLISFIAIRPMEMSEETSSKTHDLKMYARQELQRLRRQHQGLYSHLLEQERIDWFYQQATNPVLNPATAALLKRGILKVEKREMLYWIVVNPIVREILETENPPSETQS